MTTDSRPALARSFEIQSSHDSKLGGTSILKSESRAFENRILSGLSPLIPKEPTHD